MNVQVASLSDLYELCKSCYHDMPETMAISQYTGAPVYPIADTFITAYRSDDLLFLARPVTPKELLGSYLFAWLQPQTGLPGSFFFTTDSIITEVNSITPATLESIKASQGTVESYFRHVPILRVLGARLLPQTFVVHETGVQVVWPEFFSGRKYVPETMYEEADKFGVDAQMIISTEQYRLVCELRKRKTNVLELIKATAIENDDCFEQILSVL